MITATILLFARVSFYICIITYGEGILEFFVALMYYCMLRCLKKKEDVIVVDQTISLESGRPSNPNSDGQYVYQTPLIT